MNENVHDEIKAELLEELLHNDDKCLEYLASIKWANGFVCRKCGNDNYCQGKIPFSRRCTRCKNEESATSNTIFHNCKFSVSKAFYIAYSVYKGENDFSSFELAQKLSLRQTTCWNFKNKIQKAIDGMMLVNTEQKLSMQELVLSKNKFSEKFKTF
jgi:predicted Zn-ribbon and HTH transcriptional regulator